MTDNPHRNEMTLRDHFAACVAAEMFRGTAAEFKEMDRHGINPTQPAAKIAARAAYTLADEMLVERQYRGGEE